MFIVTEYAALRSLFCLFLSGHLRQVLLYMLLIFLIRFILIDSPIHTDTNSMELSILYLKGLPIQNAVK